MSTDIKRAEKALQKGNLDLCDRLCKQLLAADPSSVPAQELMSRSAAGRGDFMRAILLATQMLSKPGIPARLGSRTQTRIAGYHRILGNLPEAEKHYRAAIAQDTVYPGHYAPLITFLYENARFDEARELVPGWLSHLVSGSVEIDREDFGAVSLGLYNVSQLADKANLSDWLQRLEAIHSDDSLQPLRSEASFSYALGSLLDRSKQFDEALEHMKQANRLRRKESGYRVEPVLDQMQQIANIFDQRFFNSPDEATPAPGDPRIVFIVGMPRSGTSLVEQVFASHSRVRAIGESHCLAQSVATALQQRPDCKPTRPRTMDAALFASIRRLYLQCIGFKRGQEVITDKMPANLMYAWAIRKAFPDAKIVLCQREKLATVMSCFATNFTTRNCFSESIEDCSRYYDKTYECANLWRERLGGMILHQLYEDLVRAPTENITRLLDHVALEHEDACYKPHESTRVVSTASIMQVTQPIYKTGNERWQPYQRLLGPEGELLSG